MHGHLSVQLFATLRAIAHQASLFIGFFRQEYWSGLPCPPSGDLLELGIEPASPASQANSLPTEPPGKPLLIVERELTHPSTMTFG